MTAVTQAGAKLYIAVDGSGDAQPQASDLNLAAYEALTWLQVKHVGSFGETGADTAIVEYDTQDDDVTLQAKSSTKAGNPEIQLARNATDPGQIEMRAAALTKKNYAFKRTLDDQITPSTGNPTIQYNRGVVSGPKMPNGSSGDFTLEVYTLGLNQRQIVDEAT